MKNLYSLALLIVTTGITMCMELPSVEYTSRLAQEQDIDSIIELIEIAEGNNELDDNHPDKHSRDKIVILPKKFRRLALEHAIAQGKIFVSQTARGKIVAYKKLFAITDLAEQREILGEEIRCLHQPSCQSGYVDLASPSICHTLDNALISYPQEDAYIYNGGDFTHYNHRNKGINRRLTDYALARAIPQLTKYIKGNNSKNLLLIYGLTKANAGQELDQGRTSGILASFIPYSQQFHHGVERSSQRGQQRVYLARYPAFMPTFDPEAQECKPLPDASSIPGYGCVLKYALQ